MESEVTSPDTVSMSGAAGFESKPPVGEPLVRSYSGSLLVSATMDALRSIVASTEADDMDCDGRLSASPVDRLMPPLTFHTSDMLHADAVASARYFSVPVAPDGTTSTPSQSDASLLEKDRRSCEDMHLLTEENAIDAVGRKQLMRQMQTTASVEELQAYAQRGVVEASAKRGAPVEHLTADGADHLVETGAVIARVLSELENLATPEVQLLCSIVEELCLEGLQESDGNPASSGCASSSKRGPHHNHHHHTDSSSEAVLRDECRDDLPTACQQVSGSERWWFRGANCHFTPRPAQAQLNDAEAVFVLNGAFHCPVRPIARLFQLLLRSFDVRGLMPCHYHSMLLRTGRRSSFPDDFACDRGGAVHRLTECRRVPPPTIPLTEYSQYLELLDAWFGRAASIPRPLARCPRMLQAANTRNQVLGAIFMDMGEVCNYYRVLSGFPTILAQHHRTMQLLFVAEGPIPIPERFMIAIMAASRHRCEYLLRRYAAALMTFADERADAECFLAEGPNERLRILQKLIAVMAHVPWTVTAATIADVLETSSWSISELMQAVCIIATVLPLCGLTMGLGVPAEISTCALLPPAIFPLRPIPPLPLLERGANSCDDIVSSTQGDGDGTTRLAAGGSGIGYLKYCGADNVHTVARISRGLTSAVRSINEASFNWQLNASTLIEQYYPQFADLLSEEMASVDEVVRHHQDGGKMVHKASDSSDASFVWRSLRHYILNLIGVTADDFPYESINKVLTRGVKTFAQKCYGYPERLCVADLMDWAKNAEHRAAASGASPQGQSPPLDSNNSAAPAASAEPSHTQQHPLLPSPEADDKQWFTDEVTLALVAIMTFATRREGVLVVFLSEFAAYQRSL